MVSRFVVFLFCVFCFYTCQNKPKVDTKLNELFNMMQGSFNSEKQAKLDSTYFNISLHMYPIWKDKGNYLYVEQALNNRQNKPYRQRIYKVSRLNDSMFSSEIYTIKSDSLWIGKWKNPNAFDTLPMENITLRKGCEVLLKQKTKMYYIGKTGHKTCESSLYGASYATSEVEIFEDKIISWDRGFDTEGNHIWGAKNGGYVFDKLN